LSREDDIRGDLGSGGDVAAGELDVVAFGEAHQAFKKFVGPALRQFCWQSKREKACEGLATHGSDIAEAAGETAVAHAAGGMPLAAKVHVFNGKVSGDEKFVAGGKAHYRTVVSNALYHGAIAASGGETANAPDQLLFTGNQDEVNYIQTKELCGPLFLFFLETLVPPLPGLRTFATTFPALTRWATLANARCRACRRWSMEVSSDF
jgi:hypothetical protein